MRGASYPLDKLARVLRRAARLALVTLLATALFPSPARAQSPGRVVVLTVDGTSIQDWAAAGAFSSFGSMGLLATRTGASSKDPVALRASAYASLGAGTALELVAGEPVTKRRGDAVPGLLGEALLRTGAKAVAIGDASGTDVSDAPAGLATMDLSGRAAIAPDDTAEAMLAPTNVSRLDGNSPGGRRTDRVALHLVLDRALEWAKVIVVDLGDAERADRTFGRDPAARAEWVARALEDASLIAEDVREQLTENDTLVVASLAPPLERAGAGVNLGAVAFLNGRGAPTSGTTRQRGVIALGDLGPTLLRAAGIEPPEQMHGRVARFEPESSRLLAAAGRDADLARALRSRRPLTRAWLIAAAALSAMAFIVIAAGRGRAPPRSRLPRGVRDALGIGLIAVSVAPGAFLVAPIVAGGHSVAAVGWWAAGLSLAGALAARVSLGYERGLAVAAVVVAALVAADLIAGSPLASRSAIGFQVAGGGRFYGVDEGMLGVMLAAPLVGGGVLMDHAHRRDRMLALQTIGLAAIAFLAAAPAFGSKFGAPYTLVPAFGVFCVLAAGRRFTKRHAIGVAIATLLLSASLAAVDALGAPEARSHIGNEVAGRTAVPSLVGRKLTSLAKVTTTTAWLPAVIVIGGTAALLMVRRRDLYARAMWGRPAARGALAAGIVGCLFAMASNDTGIITVGAAAPFLAAGFYGALLVPDQGEL
jgi:hypothetical protein